MFLAFQTLLLIQAINFGHSVVVIEFDETQVFNRVNLDVNLSLPTSGSSYCIQVFLERYSFTLLFEDGPDFPWQMSFFMRFMPDSLHFHQWHYRHEYYMYYVFPQDQEPIVKSHEWTTVCTSIDNSHTNYTSIQIGVNGAIVANLTHGSTRLILGLLSKSRI